MSLSRIALVTGILALATGTAAAQTTYTPFTPGNLVVYTAGTGTGSLDSSGNLVVMREYTTTGTLVGEPQQMPLDFIVNGTATSEGQATISPNGRYISIVGYKANAGTFTNISTTTTAQANRSVIVFDNVAGTYTRTDLTDFASSNNARSAVTTNGTDLWLAGSAGGVRHTTVGSSTSTQVSNTLTNVRTVNVFDGQLYVSTGSGTSVRIGTVGAGTPTTSGQTITNLPGFITDGSPYAYFFADLNAGVAGVDTLYVADDANGLRKFSLFNGNWTSNGTIGAASNLYRGLTGVVSGTSVTLYATRAAGNSAAGGGELVSLTDTSGYNGAFSGTPTVLATADANTAFRSVVFVPVPEPATVLAFAAGALGVGRLVRRRLRAGEPR